MEANDQGLKDMDSPSETWLSQRMEVNWASTAETRWFVRTPYFCDKQYVLTFFIEQIIAHSLNI